MQSLSQYLAAALLNGTRKKFSSLQADYLKEITMSNSENTTNMGVTSQVNVGPTKPVGHKAIEGTNKGDHRSQAAQPVMPPQPAVRSENNDAEGA